MEYEYVSKKEYRPVKEELERIIRSAQKYMQDNYGYSFRYDLVGSGQRHLITRLKGGNKGFDFDYNLILENSVISNIKPKEIKERFMESFGYAIKGTKYKHPEDSTAVMTIKVVDTVNSKIVHSCDFAIVYYPQCNIDGAYNYLKNLKNGNYLFEIRSQSKGTDRKLQHVLEQDNGWNQIREEYLKLKNSNQDPDKYSYVLYLEAINNVYNQIKQSAYPMGLQVVRNKIR